MINRVLVNVCGFFKILKQKYLDLIKISTTTGARTKLHIYSYTMIKNYYKCKILIYIVWTVWIKVFGPQKPFVTNSFRYCTRIRRRRFCKKDLFWKLATLHFLFKDFQFNEVIIWIVCCSCLINIPGLKFL